MDNRQTVFRNVFLSAAILAIANMGDAFLYAWLPTHFQEAGITPFAVGAVLSVNRLTRLFMNARVARFLSSRGIKMATFTAVIAASFATFSYGWMSAIPLWILTRVLWGICFSTLRLGSTLYALEYPKRGMALGLSRGLIELGPVVALVVGPLLLESFGRGITFFVFGLVGLAGGTMVLFLSDIKTRAVTKKELKLSSPSPFNLLTLSNAFITEGVLVVLVGKITHNRVFLSWEGLVLTGFLLSYRRISFVIFSPLAGWLADKWGFQKLFFNISILTSVSLVLILFGADVIGIVVAFTFSAMNASICTGGAISANNLLIKEISDNATWRDIGTAAGAFAGAALLSVSDLQPYFIALFLVYAVSLIRYYYKTK
ncbi:MFS transporter [Fluviicola sp.]|uniref:MFS transporter n=1 Tax=Fluviicola sp. TaxID=1917219 RepID=UPI002632E9C2|nr:MFS transporter [Fluviicola sp.]